MPVLPGNSGHHLAPLAGPQPRIDPGDLAGIRRHRRIHQQPFKGMIEIPVIHDVLVIPDDLAGIRVQRQRRVVIQVRLVVSSQQELRRGRRHGSPDIEHVQLGIEARNHPRAHVPALRVGNSAPGFVARFARLGNRTRSPQFLAGNGVVRRDDAAIGAELELAAARRKNLAVGDERSRGLLRRSLAIIDDARFPGQLARSRHPARRENRPGSYR